MPSHQELYDLHQQGLSYRDIAERYGLSRDGVRGRVSKARKGIELQHLRQENEALKAQLTHSLGTPWTLDWSDYIVVGDVHLSTVKHSFLERPLQIAMKHLQSPRRLLIAGDFFNATAFSDYDDIHPEPSFDTELIAAERFFKLYLDVFDEIRLIAGNHDRRVQKKTRNAISFQRLIRMVSASPKVKASHWGHVVVKNQTGTWRVTHGSEYSVNQLTVADWLALKNQMHIVSHHEHHFSMGLDRYKRYIIINNGGLFDQSQMAYTVLDDNKKPNMANGFTLFRGGYPTLFGETPWTNWGEWVA